MNETRQMSRLLWTLDGALSEPSFRIIDYKNNLFTSNDPERIIEYYRDFDNIEELIQWMRKAPKGVCYTCVTADNNHIILAITNADYNGKYPLNCRKAISFLRVVLALLKKMELKLEDTHLTGCIRRCNI